MQELLAPLPTEILALIDDQLICQISRTRRALAKAQVQYDIARAELRELDGKSGKPGKEKKDGKLADGTRTSTGNEKGKEKEAAIQLNANEIARHLLLDYLTSEHATVDEELSEKTETPPDIHGLPKLTRFLICVSEDISSNRRVHFESGVFSGAPLFQDDEDDLEKPVMDEETYTYVGGVLVPSQLLFDERGLKLTNV